MPSPKLWTGCWPPRNTANVGAAIWLDTARYADTKGDIKQNQDVPLYPYAWTYRDYVVRSFNEDKPYNRFVIEQIAADQLPGRDRFQQAGRAGFPRLGPALQ